MIIHPDQIKTRSLQSSSHGDAIGNIIATVLNGADAGLAIKKHVSRQSDQLIVDNLSFDLNKFIRLHVIGAGKAAAPMAAAINDLLGDKITSGLVITKHGYLETEKFDEDNRIQLVEASHPLPDQRNIDATKRLLSLTNALNTDDLVIFLLSGGGSALMTMPSAGITVQDIQSTTSALLYCGATITELNTARKHLDRVKGGGLAKLLYPATVISLILSDVLSDPTDMIASGPTAADPTRFMDAWEILKKYQITDQVPSSIKAHISSGMNGALPETVKPGDPILDKVANIIVGNNSEAVLHALEAARQAGFNPVLLTTSLIGEASQAGRILSEGVKSLLSPSSKISTPACFIAGGETTVTVKGNGLGGRNQELALGAVMSLSGSLSYLLVALATDGGDGPTDAAGAVVTNETYNAGITKGLNPLTYLQNNDSYHYFEPLGDLIKTGPTSTNVNDLVFIFAL